MAIDRPSWMPTSREVAANLIASAVIGVPSAMVAGIFTWWADPNTTRAGVVLFFMALTLGLAIAWVLFAWGWRIFFPARGSEANVAVRDLAKGIADATAPFRRIASEEPPFVVRLVGGWDHVRVDHEVEGGGYDVVKIELVNTRPVHVAGIEVFISGESHHLNTRRKYVEKIPQFYLTSRRQVDHLNPEGKEEYVLLSRELHERPEGGIRTFWGDYRFTPHDKRLSAYVHENAVHLIEITVSSPTTPLFTSRMMVIVTDRRYEQVVPIDPKARGWITISG